MQMSDMSCRQRERAVLLILARINDGVWHFIFSHFSSKALVKLLVIVSVGQLVLSWSSYWGFAAIRVKYCTDIQTQSLFIYFSFSESECLDHWLQKGGPWPPDGAWRYYRWAVSSLSLNKIEVFHFQFTHKTNLYTYFLIIFNNIVCKLISMLILPFSSWC